MKLKLLALALVASFAFYSCSDDDDNNQNLNGIPKDEQAEENPKIDSTTTSIPNVSFGKDGNNNVININMTGIFNKETQDWLELFGTNDAKQNIWVTVDNTAKGILVIKNTSEKKSLIDLVFLVDNSVSMDQEADSVASGIVKWATDLDKRGLDIQFGCVGYESGINGALNLGNLSQIDTYLSRNSGIYRTRGYAGTDSLALLTAAITNQKGNDECGGEALYFADSLFSFRASSNRIYVNFTDEPNQPNGYEHISVEYVKYQKNWNTSQGTIHTVFSEDTTLFNTTKYNEKPWLMSTYTGGTKMFTNQHFTGVNLSDLPVTGAMNNSYTVRFNDDSTIADGEHTVKITIKSTDGKVQSEKVFENVKFGK